MFPGTPQLCTTMLELPECGSFLLLGLPEMLQFYAALLEIPGLGHFCTMLLSHAGVAEAFRTAVVLLCCLGAVYSPSAVVYHKKCQLQGHRAACCLTGKGAG